MLGESTVPTGPETRLSRIVAVQYRHAIIATGMTSMRPGGGKKDPTGQQVSRQNVNASDAATAASACGPNSKMMPAA